MTVTIRPLRGQDLKAIVCLIEGLALFHDDVARIDPDTLARDALSDDPWLRVIVAEREDALVGYAALLRTAQLQFGARGMDLHHIFVVPNARRQGVGQALLTEARAIARAEHCTYLTVGTDPINDRAAAFYQRNGMTRRPQQGPRFIARLDQPPT